MTRRSFVALTAALVAIQSAGCPYDFPPPDGSIDGDVGCGNGLQDPGEGCDDGNTLIDDGCNALCQIEPGWACIGIPSNCSPICGDGLQKGDEGCDDGNRDNTDDCPDDTTNGGTCQPAFCGDGHIRSGLETCDDGNQDNSDDCPDDEANGGTCQSAFCGDGFLWAGQEACDDGNTVSADGCSDTCVVDCSNGSTTDCNYAGSTIEGGSALVDATPPAGFVQCAGFINTALNDDVDHNWEANCLGADRTLRVRYWDVSQDPWVLLGDATLTPDATSSYEQQTFDASNNGGTEGFLANQGVVFLKDDPLAGGDPSWLRCDFGGTADDYAANDFYAANRTNTRTLWVCSADVAFSANICSIERELALVDAPLAQCTQSATTFTNLGVALYFRVN